jgi:hypothetical protein
MNGKSPDQVARDLVDRLIERCERKQISTLFAGQQMIEELKTIIAETIENDRNVEVLVPNIASVRDVMIEARETIKFWHGEEAFDVYDWYAPEMNRINVAIGALTEVVNQGTAKG